MAIKINPDPMSCWMQLKLISPQLQNLYGPMIFPYNLPPNNFEVDMQYQIHENISSMAYSYSNWNQSKGASSLSNELSSYDSSLLNNDIKEIAMKENIDKGTPKPSKAQERVHSFSSTGKSTSNSHQENIPSSSMARGEELKYELSLFKNVQDQGGTDKSVKSGKKNPKIKKLDVLSKIREPLSVRKFDKNSQALGVKSEFENKSSVFLSSTLPAKCLGFDLLNENSLDDSNSKVVDINSSF